MSESDREFLRNNVPYGKSGLQAKVEAAGIEPACQSPRKDDVSRGFLARILFGASPDKGITATVENGALVVEARGVSAVAIPVAQAIPMLESLIEAARLSGGRWR